MLSLFEQAPLSIAGRLQSLPAFQYIPVTTIRPRSEAEAMQLQTRIDSALAGSLPKNGKSGAAVIVQMPVADTGNDQEPGPFLDVFITIKVIENPPINMSDKGTQRSAEHIALDVLNGLHFWNPGISGVVITAAKRAIEPALDLVNFPGKLIYDCNVKFSFGLRPLINTPRPQLVAAGALPAVQVTLTASVPDVPIWYTLDGSFPGPAAPALLYTAPTAVTEPLTVRAAAYAPGLPGSDVVFKTIN